MDISRALIQTFKQVTKHPDMALIDAIKAEDLDGVKKAFARGADVNAEFNSLVHTDCFIYTPAEFAVTRNAPTEIVTEILSHKPDLTLPRFNDTVGSYLLAFTDIREGKRSNGLNNVKAVIASGLAQPSEHHLFDFLCAAARNGRRDLVEFLATQNDVTRSFLKKKGNDCADITQTLNAPMAALLRAKVAELSAPANDTGPAVKPAAGFAPK